MFPLRVWRPCGRQFSVMEQMRSWQVQEVALEYNLWRILATGHVYYPLGTDHDAGPKEYGSIVATLVVVVWVLRATTDCGL